MSKYLIRFAVALVTGIGLTVFTLPPLLYLGIIFLAFGGIMFTIDVFATGESQNKPIVGDDE